jgi:hypothetical protein
MDIPNFVIAMVSIVGFFTVLVIYGLKHQSDTTKKDDKH